MSSTSQRSGSKRGPSTSGSDDDDDDGEPPPRTKKLLPSPRRLPTRRLPRQQPSPSIRVVIMCVGRGDKWLLEKRATDGAVCPPGGKIESRQSMYELERGAALGCRVGSWKLTSRFTSMQNLDRIYTITSGSHPCRNGWTFHIWSHIHAESGSDGCHICKIHVKFSARAARSLAMHVRNHMQNHI